jgi:hypothetical protein
MPSKDKWQVDWQVEIAGQDLTAAWRPVLQSITVTDRDGEASDSCSLELDDSAGQIRLPAKRSPVLVRINGARVFAGFVETVQSSGSRSAGRVLRVQAKGFDTGGKAKEPQRFHLDDADLGGFLGKLAERSGLSIKVDPQLAAIAQDYWAADGDSLISAGQRLARKYGATFKIRGDQAVFAAQGAQALGVTEAIYGDNLIDWSITPRQPRRQFAGGRAHWFDRASAAFKIKDLEFGNGVEIPALNVLRPTLADEAEADAVLDARGRENDREGGTGTVKLDLALSAVVEGVCRISGARTGVDGEYVISSITHTASRTGASVTSLELKQPGAGAGKDGRKAGSAAQPSFALPAHDTLG